ncbi:DUF2958 domain-containing protein [Neoaquamicrobium sediminum]|uniref:DUF2958 domain-containing protein n=1 Tax=Neoaquamicrobium sediminum TaxID=1849104 RepID=UPI003BAD1133
MILAPLRARLLANGRRTAAGQDIDPYPVVKLFAPGSSATWLLKEIDPYEWDRAFGLCDLGLGSPELGYVSLSELAACRTHAGLLIELDRHFRATGPLSEYANEARRLGRIVA